jgi:hypothetical protein
MILGGQGAHEPVEALGGRVVGDDDRHHGARRCDGLRIRLHEAGRYRRPPRRSRTPRAGGLGSGSVSGISVEDLGRHAENVVYTAVGLGILGFQHLAVQRRELQRRLESTVRTVVEAAERTVGR